MATRVCSRLKQCRKVDIIAIIVCIPIWVLGILFFHDQYKLTPVEPYLRLDSSTVCKLKSSGSELTATWDMTVVAVNPNRVLAISFDSLQVTISYKTDTGDKGRDVLLTTKPVPPPPSPLNTETSTAHSFKMETVSAYVGDNVANQISEGRARGSVKFVFGMLGYYRYVNTTRWYLTRRSLEFGVFCSWVEFGFSPGNWTGTLTTMDQSGACVDDPISVHFK
ncbi:hypothetical protein ACFX13_009469 [Malus domestica]|uniref:Late embryogenesis abundant protein LEA-2 subgroup domain-containing protein n=1 Tax=Malus domestica TaxID=3750 RepID=A0A498ICV6_MALDO|nr:hypothetical protein DVH24_004733 [Malus domestica]